MATLTTQAVTSSGLNATANAAGASGDKVLPNSILRVNNQNAGTVTVTLATANPATVDGNTVANKTVSIPTGQARYILVSDFYRNKADNGLATVTCSPNSSVTVEVFRA
jgi:hypothetical protein